MEEVQKTESVPVVREGSHVSEPKSINSVENLSLPVDMPFVDEAVEPYPQTAKRPDQRRVFFKTEASLLEEKPQNAQDTKKESSSQGLFSRVVEAISWAGDYFFKIAGGLFSWLVEWMRKVGDTEDTDEKKKIENKAEPVLIAILKLLSLLGALTVGGALKAIALIGWVVTSIGKGITSTIQSIMGAKK